ncbi:MAG: histidinol phosphate phosphatase [Rhodospirillales bacterium]|nr:histidinol phosphate phosphatase [Rhodospirillales bacterium]
MQEFRALANRLADAAGEIIRPYFRAIDTSETKADESPVTAADRAVEMRIRDILSEERPQDGIFGEEFGVKKSDNGLTWVIDPIDGTKPFISGRATFGTLIALCDEDEAILGVIDQPIVKDRWVGIQGEETLHNGQVCKVRTCPSLKEARCSSTSPGMFFHREADFIKKWKEQVHFITWGGDCISYGLLASGHLDLVIEADLKPYDFLAHIPIIEGAGGRMCDWQGQPLGLSSGKEVIAVGDLALLEGALRLVQ